jgi:prevent-host-death family protein
MTFMLNVHEAQAQLAQLLERARQGEEIIIAEAGR